MKQTRSLIRSFTSLHFLSLSMCHSLLNKDSFIFIFKKSNKTSTRWWDHWEEKNIILIFLVGFILTRQFSFCKIRVNDVSSSTMTLERNLVFAGFIKVFRCSAISADRKQGMNFEQIFRNLKDVSLSCELHWKHLEHSQREHLRWIEGKAVPRLFDDHTRWRNRVHNHQRFFKAFHFCLRKALTLGHLSTLVHFTVVGQRAITVKKRSAL